MGPLKGTVEPRFARQRFGNQRLPPNRVQVGQDRKADSSPRTLSDSEPDPVPGRAGASHPAPAQHHGERPVVLGQACHLPVEPLELLPQDFAVCVLPLDSLPQGFVLRAQPLDSLLQGFDLLALPPLLQLEVRAQPLEGDCRLSLYI